MCSTSLHKKRLWLPSVMLKKENPPISSSVNRKPQQRAAWVLSVMVGLSVLCKSKRDGGNGENGRNTGNLSSYAVSLFPFYSLFRLRTQRDLLQGQSPGAKKQFSQNWKVCHYLLPFMFFHKDFWRMFRHILLKLVWNNEWVNNDRIFSLYFLFLCKFWM